MVRATTATTQTMVFTSTVPSRVGRGPRGSCAARVAEPQPVMENLLIDARTSSMAG